MSDKKSEENNNINNDEIKKDEDKDKEIPIKKYEYPKMNVNKLSNLSDSIINYFVIGLCLFLNSAYNLNWFKFKEKNIEDFLFTYFLFAAIVLYIIGFMNWYEGKELLFLFDFILSFYFLVIYFQKGHFKNITDEFSQDIIYKNNGEDENRKLQGIFYIIIFCFFLILASSSFKKGIIYIINYAFLFVGFVFLFCDKFFGDKNGWLDDAHNYIFIVCGALMWIIGVMKFINQAFLTKVNVILGQTD